MLGSLSEFSFAVYFFLVETDRYRASRPLRRAQGTACIDLEVVGQEESSAAPKYLRIFSLLSDLCMLRSLVGPWFS